MEKVLSQEEISALFSAMSSEDWRRENPPAKGGPEAGDDDLQFDPQWNMARQQASGCCVERIVELVKPVHLELSGEIRGSKLRIDNLLRISVGDIIELKDRVGDPMVLCVGGVPKFTGNILQRRGKKVFAISGRIAG